MGTQGMRNRDNTGTVLSWFINRDKPYSSSPEKTRTPYRDKGLSHFRCGTAVLIPLSQLSRFSLSRFLLRWKELVNA